MQAVACSCMRTTYRILSSRHFASFRLPAISQFFPPFSLLFLQLSPLPAIFVCVTASLSTSNIHRRYCNNEDEEIDGQRFNHGDGILSIKYPRQLIDNDRRHRIRHRCICECGGESICNRDDRLRRRDTTSASTDLASPCYECYIQDELRFARPTLNLYYAGFGCNT